MDASTPAAAKTAYDYLTAGNQTFKDSIERTIAAMTEMNAHSKKILKR